MLGLVLVLTPIVGCNLVQPHVQGSGVIKSEDRKESGFTGVVGVGSETIEIVVGKHFAVTVRGDDNIVPLIETKVRDSTLHIGGKGNYSTKKGIKVTVSMPALTSLRLAGSGSMTARGIKSQRLDVILDGSGQIRASGAVDRVRSDLNGSGEIDLSNLPALSADLDLAGSGQMRANVKTSLDAVLSGSGQILYSGSPKASTRVTGSGAIRQEN
ncbi:MAG TPA: head GIN domain-containing protein [Fimbriimonadaceae bacterium]|nr:head GIN domain-containing protein [Fimbriimonadaceae bacterium]